MNFIEVYSHELPKSLFFTKSSSTNPPLFLITYNAMNYMQEEEAAKAIKTHNKVNHSRDMTGSRDAFKGLAGVKDPGGGFL